jgi:hypothetical protein
LIAVVLITFTHTRYTPDSSLFSYFIIDLPKIGTLTLSIISGYLYWITAKDKQSIIGKKIRTLAIPYLIANGIVIVLTLCANYAFGYDFLNRLSFDYSLLTEGLLSLNSPPVNPPTYFIRDIFIIFCMIELLRNRNLYMLLIIVPYAVFGNLLIRYDILVLFIAGVSIAYLEKYIKNYHKTILAVLLLICVLSVNFFNINSYKYPIALLLFLAFFDVKLKFYNVGGYSYLLHLYHSPIIVCSFPLLSLFITDSHLSVAVQILLALSLCYMLYLITRKVEKLKVLSGGR